MTNITYIVWNGVDTYEESVESIFYKSQEFKPFKVIEIDIQESDFDSDGDLISDGIFCVIGGKGESYYKAVD